MKHSKVASSLQRRKWVLMLYIMFAEVKSEDQPGIPSAGLLCISDCVTCPVICSPPPSPVNSKPPPLPSLPTPSSECDSPPSPPPANYYSPPQPYYFPSSPPTPLLTPLAPPTPKPPSPSYIWLGGAPPPPPPPPPKTGYMPSIQAPSGMGQSNYSHRYYYVYASEASSFTLQSSYLLIISLSFLVL